MALSGVIVCRVIRCLLVTGRQFSPLAATPIASLVGWPALQTTLVPQTTLEPLTSKTVPVGALQTAAGDSAVPDATSVVLRAARMSR